MQKKQSLESFLASHPKESKCFVCNLPERAEIDAALSTGAATPTQVVHWLKELGYVDTTRHKVRHHKEEHLRVVRG